jgi:prepilin-type N-terminal cleavage/methylation domain-containing protein/prepilin-type processing-associated H-X9-DG protein
LKTLKKLTPNQSDRLEKAAPNQENVRRKTGLERGGFTLIELLAVITVIAVLALVLFASYPAVRDATNRTICVQNLGTLAEAAVAYAGDNNGHFPIAYSAFPGGSSWYLGPGGTTTYGTSAGHVLLLPYIVSSGSSLLQKGFSSDPNLFTCPATLRTWSANNWSNGFNPTSLAYGCPDSSYGYYGGFYGPMAGWQATYIGSPSGTFGKSEPLFFDMLCLVDGQPPVAGVPSWPYSNHANGANIAYSDGHVERHAFPDTIFWRLISFAGVSFYLPSP